MYRIGLIFLVVNIWACTGDSTTAATQIDLSKPEAVVKKWQSHIDNNEFDAAKKLSTPAAQEWIDFIAEVMKLDGEDDTIMATVFESINCEVAADSAMCKMVIREEEELFDDKILLRKLSGQWKIDIPAENLDDQGEEMLYDDLNDFFGE